MESSPAHGELTLGPIPQDEIDALLDLDQWAFAYDPDGLDIAPIAATFEWDRAFGMWTPEPERRLVGTNLTFSMELPVPGGSVGCGGLTWVGVHPEYRRRGILRAMMDHHLRTVRDRGEPVSVLFAAEPAIYGRFGYGLASHSLHLTLPRRAALRDVPGSDGVRVALELIDPERHADLIGDCYDAARRARPGMVSRSTPALRRIILEDQPAMRKGREPLRVALAVDGGAAGPDPAGSVPAAGLRGYALFQRKSEWKDSGPDSTVQVRELVALDPAAARALWGCLTDLDLTARVETGMRPTDDPLVHQLVDLRVTTARHSDGLWARLVDVPAALAVRRYSAEVDVVLAVTDPFCPWNDGHWHLKGSPQGATCTATTADADLTLDVRDLGAAYLGGTSLEALAAAGLVIERRAGTLTPAAAAFGWPLAPWCSWVF